MAKSSKGNVLFPVFFKLHELQLLIVGGGNVGLEKLEAILKNSPDAKVTLVGKKILRKEIKELARKHPHLKVIESKYKSKHLKGKDLVILATDSRKLHEKIKKKCRKKHLMTNVADTPDLCDFYLGSVVKKGDLKIGISSNGKSPTLTKRMRQYLEEAIPENDIQTLLDNLKDVRDHLKDDFEYKVQKLNEVTTSWLSSQSNLTMSKALQQTINEIDRINAQDPTLEEHDGKSVPKELIYGQRMTEMLFLYEPNPSEIMQIAARGQHIKRWTIARNAYPMDRKGYLKWRTDLKLMHGKLLAEIMEKQGYDQEETSHVADMVTKKKLKTNAETKMLEDVICLVFLKYYFSAFTEKHPEDKVIDILQKTWKKMTTKGHEMVMKLDFDQNSMALIEKASLQ